MCVNMHASFNQMIKKKFQFLFKQKFYVHTYMYIRFYSTGMVHPKVKQKYASIYTGKYIPFPLLL